jgi:peptidoglycan/LPS O-acetylase OafA/YrhL
MTARDILRRVARTLQMIVMAALTPVLEKNFVKTLSFDTPVVFSMSRLIVLAFAIGLLHQLWQAGIAGWPEATLSMAVVLALPLLSALERLDPSRVVDLVSTLASRFGVGDVRKVANVYARDREPSKFDDHTTD